MNISEISFTTGIFLLGVYLGGWLGVLIGERLSKRKVEKERKRIAELERKLLWQQEQIKWADAEWARRIEELKRIEAFEGGCG